MENLIKYGNEQISLFSDAKHDYISLTDMAKAFKGPKSIESWMRNKNTLNFLAAWERLYNPNFRPHEFEGLVAKSGKQHFNLSVKQWVEITAATGIFARQGNVNAGTYAHKDIAFKFASWLSAEFELFIVQEFQRLKELDRQKNSYELLNHDQILFLTRLKEVFKFVAHQQLIEDTHKEVFASKSNAKNPFAEFHKWRNEVLGISPQVINERIRQYCIDNQIAITKRMLNKSKREQILMLDSYESVRNAVWDFLKIKGEVNAFNLANLVGEMLRIEKGEVLRVNEDNLFGEKLNLGDYNNFDNQISEMKEVKTAREFLKLKAAEQKKLPELSPLNKKLKQALDFKPKDK